MFAVLKTGGKQYKVSSGDVLRVEKLAADAGDTVQFNDVLMVDDQIGTPFLAGAAVQATVIDQIKGDKTIHFVRRRRKHSSKRTKGHRQQLTLVRVTEILATGGDVSGVKSAIGAGFREPQFDAPRGGVVAQAMSSVAAPVAAAVAPVANAAKRVVKQAAPAATEVVTETAETLSGVGAAVTGVIGAVLGAAASAAVAAITAPRDAEAEPDASDVPDTTASSADDAPTKE